MTGKLLKIGSCILPGSILLLVLLLLYSSKSFFLETGTASPIEAAVIRYDGKEELRSLPLFVTPENHDSEVRVSFDVPAENGKCLFFGSVYAPLHIYGDQELLYEYGEKGSFPSFLSDPPTQYDSLLLPYKKGNAALHIDMVYRSPNERDALSIHAPLFGTEKEILHSLIKDYGSSFALSLLFLALGFLFAVVPLFVFRASEFSQALFFPGIFTLLAAAWQFGENTLSVYLFQNPTLLYFMDFLGLFLFAIPLYYTARLYLAGQRSRLLNGILILLELSAAAAILLQLTGQISFHRSLYFFHFLIPLATFILCAYILHAMLPEANRDEEIPLPANGPPTISRIFPFRRSLPKNKAAKFLLLPFSFISLSAILELLNYYCLHFTDHYAVIFQAGMFLFALTLLIISTLYLRLLFNDQIEKKRLENELLLQHKALDYQKDRIELLTDFYDEIRRLRHDLRHHLHTIANLIEKKEYERTKAYIASVTETIPSISLEIWCENPVVNSAISYYAQLAKELGIELKIQTEIPKHTSGISDMNLCVIFGNLLENAIEACRNIKNGSKFIRLSSRIQGQMLFITMDNTSSTPLITNGKYYSVKHGDTGTGLHSIRSLAESHGGNAVYSASENMFHSEIYMKISE